MPECVTVLEGVSRDRLSLDFAGQAAGVLISEGPDGADAKWRVDGGQWSYVQTSDEYSNGFH